MSGRCLPQPRLARSNIVRVGEAQVRDSLHRAVRQVSAAAGITPEQVKRTCLGGSGAGRPELARVVREILAEILSTPIGVVGDNEIALEAAFDTSPGVIVIAGTGSIAYGRDQQGKRFVPGAGDSPSATKALRIGSAVLL